MTVYRNIEILYEDNHLLVVNKPAGMLSQGDISGDEDIQTLLKNYLKEKYQKPGKVFLALVQRLDRPTSGLMVLARTSKAASRLSDQMRKKTIVKKYRAVVESSNVTSGVLTHYLLKDPSRKISTVFDYEIPESRKAVSEVSLIAEKDGLSLVSVTLQTGRFHQIRAQLSHLGIPIAGDQKYGSKMALGGEIALMCNYLEFGHPTSQRKIRFSATVPNIPPWNRFPLDW